MLPIAEMIIGFINRTSNISEADRQFQQQQRFLFEVAVMSMGVSEITINVTIETRPTEGPGRIAEVAHLAVMNFLDQDALFGSINPDGDLDIVLGLVTGSTILQTPLRVTIINDMDPEPVECFELLIVSPDVPGDRDIYRCFDDNVNSDSFFCLHEICISDDDGLFRGICLDVLSKNMFLFLL